MIIGERVSLRYDIALSFMWGLFFGFETNPRWWVGSSKKSSLIKAICFLHRCRMSEHLELFFLCNFSWLFFAQSLHPFTLPKTRLRPWLRPWVIFTWHFLEDARNGARVLISMYGLLVHMFISPHFFHGFVSSQRRFAWNSCVLEPFDEKKTPFYSSSSRIVGFLGQFAKFKER